MTSSAFVNLVYREVSGVPFLFRQLPDGRWLGAHPSRGGVGRLTLGRRPERSFGPAERDFEFESFEAAVRALASWNGEGEPPESATTRDTYACMVCGKFHALGTGCEEQLRAQIQFEQEQRAQQRDKEVPRG